MDLFFAVTVTSIYSVHFQGNIICLQKICSFAASSVREGRTISGKKLLINFDKGLVLTGVEAKEHRNDWFATSAITALFETEADAIECTRLRDLQPNDPRWQVQTSKVLQYLREEHPNVSFGETQHEAIMRDLRFIEMAGGR